MEHLHYRFEGRRSIPRAAPQLVGVVASGNLEVLVEPVPLAGECVVDVATPARGFRDVWDAVIADFFARHPYGDLQISINDNAATPATVALRLDQAITEYRDAAPHA
jgi:malonate decarboxylase delta subunit